MPGGSGEALLFGDFELNNLAFVHCQQDLAKAELVQRLPYGGKGHGMTLASRCRGRW